MTTNDTPTWLDEALASYQPISMTPAAWERFRVDACKMVRQLNPGDRRAARKCLSRLGVFLADLAAARPEATLEELLTREQVQGHLTRALAQGASGKTIENRQGTLNALLRVQRGLGPPAPRVKRDTADQLQPYAVEELQRVVAAALADGDLGGVDLARSLACVLAGVPLPTPARDRVVTITREGGELRVDGQPPIGADLPGVPAGELRASDVARGRRFASRKLDFRLDVRRAALTSLTEQVRIRPAGEVLALEGVGRARLTAAVTSCGPADPSLLRSALRGARLSGGAAGA